MQAITAMKLRGGAVQYVDKHELNMVTENRLHQVRQRSLQLLHEAHLHILQLASTSCTLQPVLCAHRSGHWIQGLVLDCAPLDWERLEEFEEATKASQASSAQLPVWLALDEIGDPVSLSCCLGY